jgi:hypothetical protein
MRWNARSAGMLAGLLAGSALAAAPCVGGEGFLNRNAKVNEAIPYGRSPEELLPTAAAATPPATASPAATPNAPQS